MIKGSNADRLAIIMRNKHVLSFTLFTKSDIHPLVVLYHLEIKH